MDELEILWKRLRSKAGHEPSRSGTWLALIRARPCSFCGAPAPSDPHHIFGSYGPMKTDDVFTIPLCRRCHQLEAEKHENRSRSLEAWVQIAREHLTRPQD